MEKYKKWLEEQIEKCLNDKDLQREHWAYCTAYRKLIEALPIHGVGGPVSDVRSEGEQLGNEAVVTKPVRRFENCYIRNKIGCHCTDECGYDALMRGMSDEAQP